MAALVEVDIWGEKVRLSSTQGNEFVQRIADYLNDKMREVKLEDPAEISTKKLILKVAVMVASENLLMQQEVGKLEFAVEQIEVQFESLRL